MKTIIIGGGAAGLAAAITLKQGIKNSEVIILERLPEVGKKLLATGNGRCNLTNTSADGCKTVTAFFSSIGLRTRIEDEGRVYPYSLKAETVVEILKESCASLGIRIITECEVMGIDSRLNIQTSKGSFSADYVILATGGKAQSALGSNGSGYTLLSTLSHTVTPLSPALVQLVSSSRYPRQIKGTRTKCRVSIELDGEIAGEEYGEVLFTDYGLSGIAIMNLSCIASKNFEEKSPKKCLAVLDLIPEMNEEEILDHISSFGSLKGILGSKLANIISKQAGGNKALEAAIAKKWRLIITGTKGYNYAQITQGGIPLSELNGFESLIIKNLYICGEILDRQFPCGGFNLDFAFSSGISAANSIKEKQNDKN